MRTEQLLKQSQALVKLLEPGGKLKSKLVPNEKHNMEMIEWFAADYFKFLDERWVLGQGIVLTEAGPTGETGPGTGTELWNAPRN